MSKRNKLDRYARKLEKRLIRAMRKTDLNMKTAHVEELHYTFTPEEQREMQSPILPIRPIKHNKRPFERRGIKYRDWRWRARKCGYRPDPPLPDADFELEGDD